MPPSNNSALYTGDNWTNQNFLNFLAACNPNPFGFANWLRRPDGQRCAPANAAAAGVPANFFLANPDLSAGLIVSTNIGPTKYHSLQLELRRRYAQGLQFQTSYVFGKAMSQRLARPSASPVLPP